MCIVVGAVCIVGGGGEGDAVYTVLKQGGAVYTVLKQGDAVGI